VSDEDFVFERHTVADERVTLNLAVGPDDRSSLYLDERTDTRVVTDAATVEVRERMHDNVLAKLDVVQLAVRSLVGRSLSHA
jgi:hypothetical protein